MRISRLFVTLFSATAVTGCSQVADIAKRLSTNNSAVDIAPYIYLSTYSYGGKLAACLTSSERALRAHGFTENSGREIKDKYGTVWADNPKELISAKVECDSNLRITALAVSSLNNDTAYATYERLTNAKWWMP